MERLTIENEPKFCRHIKKGVTQWQVIERLAELEDEIENGIYLKPPCKVGDTIYFVDEPLAEFNKIQELVVQEIRYTKDECQIWFVGDLYLEDTDFGKYVFATREEAEKRLEELKR